MGEKVSDAMWAIMLRYGRHWPGEPGKLIFCTPSRVELAGHKPARSAGKVIYDTEQLAQAAALAILNLTGTLLYSYECHRSTRRHHRHLTSERPRGRIKAMRGGQKVKK